MTLDPTDELTLRRAAAAARNIRSQASALPVAWFDWVAPWLDGLANRLASTPDDVDEEQPDDASYDAWVLLANGAYWDHTDPKGIDEWNAARDRWRDRWHATLSMTHPHPARATGVAAAAPTAVSGRSEHRSPTEDVAPGTGNESDPLTAEVTDEWLQP